MTAKFIKVANINPVTDYVAGQLKAHLEAGERVLWLVGGGSVLPLASAITKVLAGAPLQHFAVSITDERPGPVGHPDSNWLGLQAAGFELPGATLQPVLNGTGAPAETTAFAQFLDRELSRCDFKLGVFGIGPDGHAAGLPAQNAPENVGMAAYYETGPFRRISMTPAAIARLSEAVAFVMGEPKHPQLDRLVQNLTYSEQSAQSLKLAPKLTVFNDYKGDAK